jgi:DNA polymerase-3 subunit beta
MGDNEGTLEASVEGDETQIAFNGRYLREALEAIDAPHVQLQITGPSSPGIIKPAGEPNGYIHVIMPMHVAR